MATFSVIIPVYNAALTIERCVTSIVAGGEDMQIILVDDCSKDNSWEACCRLAEQYSMVLALRNERNRGVSHTRNRGLEAATGEYLLFADSDDWVDPQWAPELLKEARRDPHWMPVCGFLAEDEETSVKQKRTWSDADCVQQVMLNQAFDLMDKSLLQQLWTKAFCRETVERHHIRFDETQTMGEDLQFVLEYLEHADLLGFAMISKPLYHYNCTGSGLMSRFGLANRDEEYRRVEQLGRITGEAKRCADCLEALKKNHVYHILRSELPGREKRRMAKEILGNEAVSYCCSQLVIMLKDRVAGLLQTFR